MKKLTLLILFINMIMFFSCSKDELFNDTSHQKNKIATDTRGNHLFTKGYTIVTKCGHPEEKCKGCVTAGGTTVHVKCQGPGSECQVTAKIIFQTDPIGDVFEAYTADRYDLSDQGCFLMPSRSLAVEDFEENRRWLNIPGQLLRIDSITGQFIFRDLFFSSTPEYQNE